MKQNQILWIDSLGAKYLQQFFDTCILLYSQTTEVDAWPLNWQDYLPGKGSEKKKVVY